MATPPKKNLESPHTIISVTLLATGRLIMATEKRMYELINDVWTPMKFADDEPDPVVEPDPAAVTVVTPPVVEPTPTTPSWGTETHT